MTPNFNQKLIQLEDLIPETNLVATIDCDPATFGELHQLEFQESYDDLDFLVFALLPLPSIDSTTTTLGKRVALVIHKHAPVPSVEICVHYELENVGVAIAQTLDKLNLTSEDLAWIHPQYKLDFFNALDRVKQHQTQDNHRFELRS
jgi:hypothetical protein